MLNRVCMMGRLGKDPEMRQTTTGKSVASFRIACDRGRKDANGQNAVDWFDVIAWEKSAEFVCKYFQKGSLIVVDGRLQTRKYQDKNGNNRTVVEIVADNLNFGGSKQDTGSVNNGYQQPQYQQGNPHKPASQSTAYPPSDYDDFTEVDDSEDLPF